MRPDLPFAEVRTLQSIPPYWAAFKESLYDELGDPATDAELVHLSDELLRLESDATAGARP